jgi:hypothetical protein
MSLIQAVRKLSHPTGRTHREPRHPDTRFLRAGVSPVPWPEPARLFSAFLAP